MKNTASNEMIKHFKELRKEGITYFICTASRIEKTFKPIIRKTAEGVSRYANKMFCKYNDISVEVGYYDTNFKYHVYCTYQA